MNNSEDSFSDSKRRSGVNKKDDDFILRADWQMVPNEDVMQLQPLHYSSFVYLNSKTEPYCQNNMLLHQDSPRVSQSQNNPVQQMKEPSRTVKPFQLEHSTHFGSERKQEHHKPNILKKTSKVNTTTKQDTRRYGNAKSQNLGVAQNVHFKTCHAKSKLKYTVEGISDQMRVTVAERVNASTIMNHLTEMCSIVDAPWDAVVKPPSWKSFKSLSERKEVQPKRSTVNRSSRDIPTVATAHPTPLCAVSSGKDTMSLRHTCRCSPSHYRDPPAGSCTDSKIPVTMSPQQETTNTNEIIPYSRGTFTLDSNDTSFNLSHEPETYAGKNTGMNRALLHTSSVSDITGRKRRKCKASERSSMEDREMTLPLTDSSHVTVPACLQTHSTVVNIECDSDHMRPKGMKSEARTHKYNQGNEGDINTFPQAGPSLIDSLSYTVGNTDRSPFGFYHNEKLYVFVPPSPEKNNSTLCSSASKLTRSEGSTSSNNTSSSSSSSSSTPLNLQSSQLLGTSTTLVNRIKHTSEKIPLVIVRPKKHKDVCTSVHKEVCTSPQDTKRTLKASSRTHDTMNNNCRTVTAPASRNHVLSPKTKPNIHLQYSSDSEKMEHLKCGLNFQSNEKHKTASTIASDNVTMGEKMLATDANSKNSKLKEVEKQNSQTGLDSLIGIPVKECYIDMGKRKCLPPTVTLGIRPKNSPLKNTQYIRYNKTTNNDPQNIHFTRNSGVHQPKGSSNREKANKTAESNSVKTSLCTEQILNQSIQMNKRQCPREKHFTKDNPDELPTVELNGENGEIPSGHNIKGKYGGPLCKATQKRMSEQIVCTVNKKDNIYEQLLSDQMRKCGKQLCTINKVGTHDKLLGTHKKEEKSALKDETVLCAINKADLSHEPVNPVNKMGTPAVVVKTKRELSCEQVYTGNKKRKSGEQICQCKVNTMSEESVRPSKKKGKCEKLDVNINKKETSEKPVSPINKTSKSQNPRFNSKMTSLLSEFLLNDNKPPSKAPSDPVTVVLQTQESKTLLMIPTTSVTRFNLPIQLVTKESYDSVMSAKVTKADVSSSKKQIGDGESTHVHSEIINANENYDQHVSNDIMTLVKKVQRKMLPTEQKVVTSAESCERKQQNQRWSKGIKSESLDSLKRSHNLEETEIITSAVKRKQNINVAENKQITSDSPKLTFQEPGEMSSLMKILELQKRNQSERTELKQETNGPADLFKDINKLFYAAGAQVSTTNGLTTSRRTVFTICFTLHDPFLKPQQGVPANLPAFLSFSKDHMVSMIFTSHLCSGFFLVQPTGIVKHDPKNPDIYVESALLTPYSQRFQIPNDALSLVIGSLEEDWRVSLTLANSLRQRASPEEIVEHFIGLDDCRCFSTCIANGTLQSNSQVKKPELSRSDYDRHERNIEVMSCRCRECGSIFKSRRGKKKLSDVPSISSEDEESIYNNTTGPALYMSGCVSDSDATSIHNHQRSSELNGQDHDKSHVNKHQYLLYANERCPGEACYRDISGYSQTKSTCIKHETCCDSETIPLLQRPQDPTKKDVSTREGSSMSGISGKTSHSRYSTNNGQEHIDAKVPRSSDILLTSPRKRKRDNRMVVKMGFRCNKVICNSDLE